MNPFNRSNNRFSVRSTQRHRLERIETLRQAKEHQRAHCMITPEITSKHTQTTSCAAQHTLKTQDARADSLERGHIPSTWPVRRWPNWRWVSRWVNEQPPPSSMNDTFTITNPPIFNLNAQQITSKHTPAHPEHARNRSNYPHLAIRWARRDGVVGDGRGAWKPLFTINTGSKSYMS